MKSLIVIIILAILSFSTTSHIVLSEEKPIGLFLELREHQYDKKTGLYKKTDHYSAILYPDLLLANSSMKCEVKLDGREYDFYISRDGAGTLSVFGGQIVHGERFSGLASHLNIYVRWSALPAMSPFGYVTLGKIGATMPYYYDIYVSAFSDTRHQTINGIDKGDFRLLPCNVI